jgi:hypothetical protein
METSKYQVIPGVQAGSKLVKLNDDYIEYIVNFIPYPFVGTQSNRQLIRAQMQDKLRAQLKGEEICLDAIPELIAFIVEEYVKAEVAPGFPIGIIIANIIGQQLSQATLSSFHKAGSEDTTTSAITLILSMLYVQKEPANQMCTIYFQNNTLDNLQILKAAQDIEGASLQDFIKKHEIMPTAIPPDYWQQSIMASMQVNLWQEHASYLRIHLNKELLYKYSLLPQNLVKYFVEISDDLKILVSPIYFSYIDIFAGSKALITMKEKFGAIVNIADVAIIEQTYLENVIMNSKELQSKHIVGIKGLKNLRTKRIMLSGLVEESVVNVNGINYPALSFNQRASKYPVTLANLTKWVTAAELPNYIDNDKIVVNYQGKLLEYLAEKRNEENKTRNYLGPIALAAEYCYAVCNGNNLSALLKKSYINKKLTICDNILVMSKVLGIEAARSFYISRFSEVLSTSGLSVDPALINILADIQSNRGRFLGTNYAGVVATKQVDNMSVGVMERTVENGTNSLFYDAQPLSASSATMVNGVVKLGTGFIDVVYEYQNGNTKSMAVGKDIFNKLKSNGDLHVYSSEDTNDYDVKEKDIEVVSDNSDVPSMDGGTTITAISSKQAELFNRALQILKK